MLNKRCIIPACKNMYVKSVQGLNGISGIKPWSSPTTAGGYSMSKTYSSVFGRTAKYTITFVTRRRVTQGVM